MQEDVLPPRPVEDDHSIVHSGGFLDDYLDNDCVALLQDETVQYFPLERCGGNVAPE